MIMGKRKYKPKKQPHALQGIISLMLALLVLAVLCFLIIFAFLEDGSAGVVIGTAGLIMLLAAIFGAIYGIRGCREEERRHELAVIGTILNMLLLCGLVFTFGLGIIL